jgi:hypothetical protein
VCSSDPTPYYSSTYSPPNRTTLRQTTQVPEDLTCVIYSLEQTFAYSTKAFTFDVKNGPVYINYTVSDYPTITRVRYVTSKTRPNTEEEVTYTIVDPDSYFEITVRDQATGEIYLQDGFGKSYGYKEGVLKLMKQGNLLFELSGNKIRAKVKLYAKPAGNIDDLSTFSYNDCIYWI